MDSRCECIAFSRRITPSVRKIADTVCVAFRKNKIYILKGKDYKQTFHKDKLFLLFGIPKYRLLIEQSVEDRLSICGLSQDSCMVIIALQELVNVLNVFWGLLTKPTGMTEKSLRTWVDIAAKPRATPWCMPWMMASSIRPSEASRRASMVSPWAFTLSAILISK